LLPSFPSVRFVFVQKKARPLLGALLKLRNRQYFSSFVILAGSNIYSSHNATLGPIGGFLGFIRAQNHTNRPRREWSLIRLLVELCSKGRKFQVPKRQTPKIKPAKAGAFGISEIGYSVELGTWLLELLLLAPQRKSSVPGGNGARGSGAT
jgi:hypothetical protein